MSEALNRHANVALLAGQVPIGPNATALWERCIAVMLDSGFRSRLPRVHATVACYVVGFALQFSARVSRRSTRRRAAINHFRCLRPVRVPGHVAVADFLPVPFEDEFAFGLGLLVEGLSGGSTPQAASRRPAALPQPRPGDGQPPVIWPGHAPGCRFRTS